MTVRGDREMLRGKLDIVETNFRALDEIAAEGHEAFRKDLRSFLAAQHALQQCVEAALDAAAHVVASSGLRRPRQYSDLFTILTEAGVFDEDLGRRLRRMAGFRNILVHRYAEIDPEETWRILLHDRKDILRCFEALLSAVEGGNG